MACVNTTKILGTGESYILPAGAELIFCSNDSALVAEDNCVEIPPTPPIVCYMFQHMFSGSNANDETCDRGVETFNYNGWGVGFNSANTRLCGPNMCYNIAAEMWSKIQADTNFAALVVGLSVHREQWDNGDQFGIKIRMYDLGVDPPIVGFIDVNNYNLLGNENPNYARVQSIGTIVDCGVQTVMSGAWCKKAYGDIP